VDTGAARAMFEDYACAMVYIEVKDETGKLDVGSGFHVGEGVFVTARHVVENLSVQEIGMTESTSVPI
jgi:S1-C subfamily serine protease